MKMQEKKTRIYENAREVSKSLGKWKRSKQKFIKIQEKCKKIIYEYARKVNKKFTKIK